MTRRALSDLPETTPKGPVLNALADSGKTVDLSHWVVPIAPADCKTQEIHGHAPRL